MNSAKTWKNSRGFSHKITQHKYLDNNEKLFDIFYLRNSLNKF